MAVLPIRFSLNSSEFNPDPDQARALVGKRKIVALVGSRGYPRLQAVRNLVNKFSLKDVGGRDQVVFLSGDARGVDRTAQEEALTLGYDVLIYPVSSEVWQRHGKRAGYLRNRLMAQTADGAFAFWDSKSPGTRLMIRLVRNMGKTVHVIDREGALFTKEQVERL